MMEKKRSVGVTVFGILFSFIGGLFFYRFSLPSIQPLIKHGLDFTIYGGVRRMAVFESILVIIIAIVMVVAGIGTLFLKTWARKLILFIFIPLVFIYSFLSAYLYVIVEGGEFISYISALLVSVIIASPLVFYFTRPKVKEQFK